MYNESWVDDEIGPTDEHGFVDRLVNPSIHLYDEIGYILVYFEDSGLFAGHYVSVTVENGVPTKAGLWPWMAAGISGSSAGGLASGPTLYSGGS
jgi:hypothetical protein